ncbi:unnamed protein product [Commensalibacter communis]|uniref:hypothetical protein n=1 Tax=Commensalibacter communis TaxID=2972786 RepID=UPI0022FFB8E6|nr:hypothetical protein [Commensalibacter communis]CAI3923883.1 unnamed protein product [Commensalibacter communis]CAI3935517.1 unnamed protein product [Commensalibacter communis]
MQVLFINSKQIIGLLFAITFLSAYQSKAQSVTPDNNNLLSLSIICPDNPQCIYSKENTLQLNISIKNCKNQNSYIPLKAMTHTTTSFYFKDIRNGKDNIIPDPTWSGPPVLFKELILLAASESLIVSTLYVIPNDAEIKNTPTHHIIFHAKTIIPIYFYASKKRIGSYKNSKFEPKQFTLKA